MGDRYIIEKLPCAACGKDHFDIYYAPSSGFDTFICEHCRTENEIIIWFTTKAMESECDRCTERWNYIHDVGFPEPPCEKCGFNPYGIDEE